MMAVLRSKSLENESHFQINPIWLVFVNLVFYVVTIWYIYRNTFSTSQKENLREKEHYDNLKKQVKELEDEIKAIKDELNEKLNYLFHKPEYAKGLIKAIRQWENEDIEEFKSNNLAIAPTKRPLTVIFLTNHVHTIINTLSALKTYNYENSSQILIALVLLAAGY